jgi:hypothetical protein
MSHNSREPNFYKMVPIGTIEQERVKGEGGAPKIRSKIYTLYFPSKNT